jgi:hypothetical protein
MTNPVAVRAEHDAQGKLLQKFLKRHATTCSGRYVEGLHTHMMEVQSCGVLPKAAVRTPLLHLDGF